MRSRTLLHIVAVMFCCTSKLYATEYHVSAKASGTEDGSVAHPFRTINQAARVAVAGDTITVHEGTYREWIDPRNGGTSDSKRITYRAATGEKVQIKGSEIITGWRRQKDGTWMVRLEDNFFKGYNSCKTELYGDWLWKYNPKVNRIHTADLYLDGKSLFEADSLCQVVRGSHVPQAQDSAASTLRWFSVNDPQGTTIYANFGNSDPNKTLTEISVRPTCFYPTKQGINYITIRGFDISQAATQWGAPTALQIGMVAIHWNKGWIIENNRIHDTKSSGITLGKEASTGDNVWSKHPEKDGSLHYIETTFKAIEHGWNPDKVGSHIVRNNEIYNCEQTAICGSMGCAFSEISGNNIHDIWVKRQYSGAEIGGIKFHGAVDTYLHDNKINNTHRGIWLDWMTQGTRVSSNMLYDNDSEDIFLEVNHGPFIIDNNICLSPNALRNQSQGGAYIHNLFYGNNFTWTEYSRYTPYFFERSTRLKGLSIITSGDDRYLNNIFMSAGNNPAQHGMQLYNEGKFAHRATVSGNVYYNQAKPYIHEQHYIGVNDKPYSVTVEDMSNGEVYVNIEFRGINSLNNPLITSGTLGNTLVSEESFTSASGESITFDKDYFGKSRTHSPSSGPLQTTDGVTRVKVWPKAQ